MSNHQIKRFCLTRSNEILHPQCHHVGKEGIMLETYAGDNFTKECREIGLCWKKKPNVKNELIWILAIQWVKSNWNSQQVRIPLRNFHAGKNNFIGQKTLLVLARDNNKKIKTVCLLIFTIFFLDQTNNFKKVSKFNDETFMSPTVY